MELTLNDLSGMLAELEQADPVEYGHLPFGEPKLRGIVLKALVEKHQNLQQSGLTPGDVNLTYMRSTALLLLENLVLNARLLLLQGQRVDVNALLRKCSGG